MKRIIFPIVALGLSAFFFLNPLNSSDSSSGSLAEKAGRLMVPQRNVAIAVVDLEAAGMSFVEPDDVAALRRLQDDFAGLPSVSRVESILNATRVIAAGEDIIVSKAIPPDQGSVTEPYLRELASALPEFPELAPYVDARLGTLLFYVYFGSKTPSIDIFNGMRAVQDRWEASIPFEFTGRGPIIAETERLITKDLALLFPLLVAMVVGIFMLFRSAKAMLASVLLIAIATATAYSAVRFIGVPDSPMLLLVPVFSLGLLSDYAIHYFYHHFHVSKLDERLGLRRSLMFPLSLTAISTITGFLSLSLIGSSGHLQIGLLIAAAVALAWIGLFFWLDYGRYTAPDRELFPAFRKAQAKLFARIAGHRRLLVLAIVAATIWGGLQLRNMAIEPYPIEQLPASTTVKRADRRINERFYGTLPFFIEIDTGEKLGILRKETMAELDGIHAAFEREDIGYAFSVLSVLKRIHLYFMGDEESFVHGDEFDEVYDALIEQYLLYYSSGVEPLEYESMLDNSYRVLSLKGLAYYRNYEDLGRFYALIDEIRAGLPEAWSLEVHGTVAQLEAERRKLSQNWLLSFLGGGALIFITVLLYYRKPRLALFSLVPSVISMLVSFGLVSSLGISIDAFSIIFVSITTGLVVDYSIHTLTALEKLPSIRSLEEGFGQILGYSGVPIFMSFITSLVSFSALFISSFQGARNLGFLLFTSLISAFFLSLYLLPLLVLPGRIDAPKQGEFDA